jgi:hypothetical protein
MSTLWQDTLRGPFTRKTSAFTTVVIVTLALGIGANAAIFSVADAVMLRPYPYPDLDRILVLNERTRSGDQMSVAWPTYQDWRAQNQVFEHLGLYRNAIMNYTGGDQAERLNGALTSSDVFGAMGVQPVAGRAFGSDEDQAGADRVAIISERFWRGRLTPIPPSSGDRWSSTASPMPSSGHASRDAFSITHDRRVAAACPAISTFPPRVDHTQGSMLSEN